MDQTLVTICGSMAENHKSPQTIPKNHFHRHISGSPNSFSGDTRNVFRPCTRCRQLWSEPIRTNMKAKLLFCFCKILSKPTVRMFSPLVDEIPQHEGTAFLKNCYVPHSVGVYLLKHLATASFEIYRRSFKLKIECFIHFITQKTFTKH